MSLTNFKSTLKDELDRLLSNGFDYLEQLCRETPSYTGEGKPLARMLLDYFQSDSKKMLYVVLWATTREIEGSNREDVVFRESNVQTELMFGYFYTKRGIKYLGYLLNPLLSAVVKHSYNTEKPQPFSEVLQEHLQNFVDRFTSINQVPLEYQRVFRHMKKEMNFKFPAPDSRFIVLSLLFLRVICPAIITPGLIKFEVNVTGPLRKALVACARVLQNLANGSLFDDEVMCAYNSFLTYNTDRVKEFFLRVTMEVPEGGVPEVKEKTKKKNYDKDQALENILKHLQGQTLEKLAKESRTHRGEVERDRLINVNEGQKWKLFKRRVDAETFLAKMDGKFHVGKISGLIRASVKCVYSYLRDYDRWMTIFPHFCKGKVVKMYDDLLHADIVASYKIAFPSYCTREYYYCKRDDFFEERSTGVCVTWTLDGKSEHGDDNFKRGELKASGVILQPCEQNSQYCWINVILQIDRKVLVETSDNIDTILYHMIQKIRTDCESTEPRSLSNSNGKDNAQQTSNSNAI